MLALPNLKLTVNQFERIRMLAKSSSIIANCTLEGMGISVDNKGKAIDRMTSRRQSERKRRKLKEQEGQNELVLKSLYFEMEERIDN